MLLNSARAQSVLKKHDLAGVIATTPENIQYVSGLETAGFLINRYKTQVFALLAVDRPADPVIVTGLGDVSAIYQLSRGIRSIHYGRFVRYVDPDAQLTDQERRVKEVVVDSADSNPPTAFDGLLLGLEEAHLTRGRVGYDEKGIDMGLLSKLSQKLPDLTLVPAWEVLREVRAVKTDEELSRLLASLHLTEKGISGAVAVAVAGCTEEDLIREYRSIVAKGGGLPLINEITFGGRSAIGSQAIQDGRLKEGDLIRFDIGCKVDGYCSDIARIFSFKAEPGERVQAVYRAMKLGEEHGISVMKPGITAGEVFEETCRAVREAGVPRYQRTHVGHAVGLEVYELPLLGPGEPTVLEDGMVFEVETPYYEIGFAGVQVEDTVVVRAAGAEVLTTLSREIEVIG